jgi:hypothetical protein
VKPSNLQEISFLKEKLVPTKHEKRDGKSSELRLFNDLASPTV